MANRTHEECDDCVKRNELPQVCNGHPEGPTACSEFFSCTKALELKAENKRLKAGVQATLSDLVNNNFGGAIKNARITMYGFSVTDPLAYDKVREIIG